MNKTSEYKTLLYRKISKRKAFVYEVNGKLYAVNGNRIFEIQNRFNKCHYDIYKRLLVFQKPKERICSSLNRLSDIARCECEQDYSQLLSFMNDCDLNMVKQFSDGMDQFSNNYQKYCLVN